MKKMSLILFAALWFMVGCASGNRHTLSELESTQIKKTLGVEVFVDEEYRISRFLFWTWENNWRGDIRHLIQESSQKLENEFDVRLVLKNLQPWTPSKKAESLSHFRKMLGSEVLSGRLKRVDPVSLIIGFTGDSYGDGKAGNANSLSGVAVVKTRSDAKTVEHEILHLLGAHHSDEPSLMHPQQSRTTDEIDPINRERVKNFLFFTP